MIIAIDGPAGSGKSTLAKLLAKELNLLFIDTGAMYRSLTVAAVKRGVTLTDEDALVSLLKEIDIRLLADNHDSTLRVLVDNEDITSEIRTPEVTDKVKFIAKIPAIRKVMVHKQRQLAQGQDVVLEGRDIGTVVFPQAEFKFYLDASIEERAKRRFKDFKKADCEVSLEGLKKDIEIRDRSDIERKVGPLKKALDSHCIDTTNLGINEVLSKMIEVIQSGK